MADLSPAAQVVLNAVIEICPAPADEIAAAALRAAALYCKRDSAILLSLADELEAEGPRGRPAATPVPVSERLPGPEDCNTDGMCWWGEPQIGDSHDATWSLCTQDDAEEFLTWGTKCGWLPADALPLPAPEGGESQP